MKLPRYLAPVATILAAGLLLISNACGIITAPFTVPAAIGENAFFNFNGTVTDPAGMPLENVTLHQTLNHTFWHPTEVQTVTNEPKTRQFNRTVGVHERGSHLALVFSKDGYYDAEYTLYARQPGTVQTAAGYVPEKSNFPVVLYPVIPADTDLRTWRGSFPFPNIPKVGGIDLTKLAGAAAGVAVPHAFLLEDGSAATPGTFYATLNAASPQGASGLQSITLQISDGELQTFTGKTYEDPLQISDTAPDGGYQKQLTLDSARLQELRGNTVTSREYFFFRTQNHYGKGYIAPFGNSFNVGIWINPAPNDRQLITHKPVRR